MAKKNPFLKTNRAMPFGKDDMPKDDKKKAAAKKKFPPKAKKK